MEENFLASLDKKGQVSGGKTTRQVRKQLWTTIGVAMASLIIFLGREEVLAVFFFLIVVAQLFLYKKLRQTYTKKVEEERVRIKDFMRAMRAFIVISATVLFMYGYLTLVTPI